VKLVKNEELEVKPVEFADFWQRYPRKCAKKDALKAWQRISPSLYASILEAIEKHKRSEDWRRDGGRYIPYPATWLNGERWEDDLTVEIVPTVDTSCRRILHGGERCGMPGISHPVHGYSCEHCNQKEVEARRNRASMPGHVREALAQFRMRSA